MTKLRRLREGLDITQRELAKRCGIDQQRISAAERAPNPARISIGTAIPLARALGIEPSEILNDKPRDRFKRAPTTTGAGVTAMSSTGPHRREEFNPL